MYVQNVSCIYNTRGTMRDWMYMVRYEMTQTITINLNIRTKSRYIEHNLHLNTSKEAKYKINKSEAPTHIKTTSSA